MSFSNRWYSAVYCTRHALYDYPKYALFSDDVLYRALTIFTASITLIKTPEKVRQKKTKKVDYTSTSSFDLACWVGYRYNNWRCVLRVLTILQYCLCPRVYGMMRTSVLPPQLLRAIITGDQVVFNLNIDKHVHVRIWPITETAGHTRLPPCMEAKITP